MASHFKKELQNIKLQKKSNTDIFLDIFHKSMKEMNTKKREIAVRIFFSRTICHNDLVKPVYIYRAE